MKNRIIKRKRDIENDNSDLEDEIVSEQFKKMKIAKCLGELRLSRGI